MVVTARTVVVRGMVVLLLLTSPPTHSETRWGRERGRSIPFTSLRGNVRHDSY
jgi:hypothetical protein